MGMLSILNILKIIKILKTSTKENGKTEKSTERVLKYGQMEPSLKECMKMIKNVELDNYF